MKGNKIGRFRQSFEESVFANLLKKISDFFHKQICSSKTAQMFVSYDEVEAKASDSFVSGALSQIKPRKKSVISVKHAVTGKIENSFFYSLIGKIIDVLLGTKIRIYGIIFFILGFSATGFGFIERYLLTSSSKDASLLWQGLAFIVFSIPLIASKDELCTGLINGRLSSAVIRFIGYEKEDVERNPVEENMAIPLVVGIILGVFTTVVQPVYYLLLIFALIYVCVVFHKPEISMIVTVATLPFLPTMLICAEIIFTLLLYLLKVIRGKRSLKLDFLDFFVLLFAVFMFFGGAFSVTPSSSLPPACVFVCFIAAYFLIVNLVKTKELLKKLLYSSVFSFLICSLYGIYQNFFATPDTTWTDEDMFSDIETRVVSTFENPNVFGEYLIMLIPVAFALFIASKRFSERALTLTSLFASVLALVYTWSRGAWLGFIAAMLILLVIINRKALGAYVFGILALPLAIPVLPASIIERFSSIGNMTDSSTSYRVFIWEAATNMINDYFVSGIGIGVDAFQTVYSEYALAGIETAPHSHNLYLQIMLELGIFGFAAFVFAMFMFFAKVFTFLKNSDNREAKLVVGAIACGVIAILVQGLTDYVWYNYRVFAFFWMMIATAVAVVNVYKEKQRITESIM